jgi:Asp/Glu/hydantoin racemase
MTASASRYKLWYQGATDRSVHSDYISRLEAHLKSVTDPDFDFKFTGVNPPASTTHALTEYRIGAAIARNVVRAEREGYDAVAITHFQDAGLHEAKSAVDIPVLGLGETTMLYACSLGRKMGLITINPAFIPWHEDQVIRYGLTQRVVGVRAVDAKVSDFMRGFASKEGYDELYPKFAREAQVLLDAGADVIVPAGGLPMLLFGKEMGASIGGAPIVNGLTVLAKMTEMTVRMKRLSGIAVSRRSNYAKPPKQALDEFMGAS